MSSVATRTASSVSSHSKSSSKTSEAKAEAERHRQDFLSLKRESKDLSEAWKKLCDALETSPEQIKESKWEAVKRGMVNFSYLLVIFSCELDVFGFALAVGSYWTLKTWYYYVKVLCVVGPVGYVTAAMMYMYHGREFPDKSQGDDTRDRNSRPRARAEDEDPHSEILHSEIFPSVPKRPLLAKRPIKIEFYHFIPVCRFFLFVKEREINDIEAVFRIITLSSVSLGMTQAFGILFFGMENNWTMNPYVPVGIVTLLINWSVTLLFFLTPIAAKMSAAVKVQELISEAEDRLQNKLSEYDDQLGEENEAEKTRLMQSLDREISTLANLKDFDLGPFSWHDKFDALKFLLSHMNDIYASI